MFFYQGFMVTVCRQFSDEEQSPLLGLPKVSEAQWENWFISYQVVAFFSIGAADKLVPFSREMVPMWLNHSSSQSTLLISQAPTCSSTCFSLWHWKFCVSFWRISISHFLWSLPPIFPLPALTSLIPRHLLLCQLYQETSVFLLQSLSPLISRPLSLASSALLWYCF